MQPNEQIVRQFAYQIWESEGKPEGQATRHWEMACILAEGQTGPADPMEPIAAATAPTPTPTPTPTPNKIPSATKRKKAAPATEKKLLTGLAEHEVTMASADPSIAPPPTRVRVSAVVDDPAAAPKKRTAVKDKTHKH